ncbi:MAG TPA: response regulator [Anaeromyxobacteraceae bacterium]|nr:response regulator [Anaeromyxobacteraceae bacterium]
MGTDHDKRRDPRVPLVLRVDYPGEPNKVRDVTENLSAGGLFIRTDRTLKEGERVPLQVSFPSLLDPVEIEVEVVRGRPGGEAGPAGVAVKVPIDRIDDRHKLASLAEIARTGIGKLKRSYRVLVVEDNPHVIEMYEYALRKLRTPDGATEIAIEYGANGHEALVRLKRQPRIDLVMADLYMPVMDGFTLVERMKADPSLLGIPTVIISAGGPDARARAESLGIDVYLQKPVQFVDVISTVRTLLKLKA